MTQQNLLNMLFMLKNDTLKNGTSRVGLYGSAPGHTRKI